MSVGYFAHSFDLINVGDLDMVVQARKMCTTLVVGVLSDEDFEAMHGRLPVIPLIERMALVEHVRGVDSVVRHDGLKTPSVPQADLLFVPADPPSALQGTNVVTLVPRQTTQSLLMRAALAPLADDSVAS